MTVQRRFLLASSLARLIQWERGGSRHIEGFFPERPDRTAFVHLEENKGLLILRTAHPDGDVEEQTEVPVAHAHALLDVCAGELDYARTKLKIGHRTAFVDQIIHPRPLWLVSIEFDREEEARSFRPLPWFGPEVTGNALYTNKAIALGRLRDTPDIPVSDAALNGLLDTLDNRSPVQPRTHLRQPARTAASPNKANLDEVEEAMMREMALTFRNSRSE